MSWVRRWRRGMTPLLAALLCGTVGYVLLHQSSAETPLVTQEAEGGQVDGNGSVVPGDGASGSGSVLFGTISDGNQDNADLDSPAKKEIAMQLVSSAENSSLNWKAQYAYIEDIKDGRGYTAGIIGFCSGTGDMLELVKYYGQLKAGNVLAKYIPALEKVNGTASHAGLGDAFVQDWKTAAADPLFQQAQDHERDAVYFDPAVAQAKADGLHALGQFIYYDAIVMHGPGDDAASFGGLRASVIQKTKPPSQGGDEKAYLSAFLDARKALMLTEAAHDDTSRVDTEQRTFLNASNLKLVPPLLWETYGDPYSITQYP